MLDLMSKNSIMSEVIKPYLRDDDVTDDSCTPQFIEIVPLARDRNGRRATECDSSTVEGVREVMPVLKLEVDDVCHIA